MKIDLTDYSCAPEIDWSMYRPADLHQASAGAASRDTGASARNSNSELANQLGIASSLPGHGARKHPAFPSFPAVSRQDNLAGASTSDGPFISDHDLGLLVVLGLSVGAIMSIIVISYVVAEQLFGV